jgi:hypothetical protein
MTDIDIGIAISLHVDEQGVVMTAPAGRRWRWKDMDIFIIILGFTTTISSRP